MSLSLSVALIIQNNEVRCFAMGPFANGKYGSVGYLMHDGMVSNAVMSIKEGEFSTCKAAIDALEDIIREVRDLNLPEQENELEKML